MEDLLEICQEKNIVREVVHPRSSPQMATMPGQAQYQRPLRSSTSWQASNFSATCSWIPSHNCNKLESKLEQRQLRMHLILIREKEIPKWKNCVAWIWLGRKCQHMIRNTYVDQVTIFLAWIYDLSSIQKLLIFHYKKTDTLLISLCMMIQWLIWIMKKIGLLIRQQV